MRCKFKCISVCMTEFGTAIEMLPVISGSEENNRFFIATPSGSFKAVVRSEVARHFKPGDEFYLDVTHATPATDPRSTE